MEIKTLKRHVFLKKKYEKKNDFDLIKVLSDSRSNHAWENQLPHVLASKNKAGYVLKNIMKAAHDKVSKSSPKHTFLRGTRREKKQQPT